MHAVLMFHSGHFPEELSTVDEQSEDMYDIWISERSTGIPDCSLVTYTYQGHSCVQAKVRPVSGCHCSLVFLEFHM